MKEWIGAIHYHLRILFILRRNDLSPTMRQRLGLNFTWSNQYHWCQATYWTSIQYGLYVTKVRQGKNRTVHLTNAGPMSIPIENGPTPLPAWIGILVLDIEEVGERPPWEEGSNNRCEGLAPSDTNWLAERYNDEEADKWGVTLLINRFEKYSNLKLIASVI